MSFNPNKDTFDEADSKADTSQLDAMLLQVESLWDDERELTAKLQAQLEERESRVLKGIDEYLTERNELAPLYKAGLLNEDEKARYLVVLHVLKVLRLDLLDIREGIGILSVRGPASVNRVYREKGVGTVKLDSREQHQ